MLLKGRSGDKVVEGIIEYFGSTEKRDQFLDFYRELETLYEIISPDEFLRSFMNGYLELSKIYEIVINARSVRPIMDLMRKTEELVRSQVKMDEIGGTTKVYEINDNTLKAIKEDDAPDNTKVINLARSLVKAVDYARDTKPFLVSIADRATSVLESLGNRQVSTQDALRSMERLVEEYNQASKEMTSRKMDTQTFSAYWILKQAGLKNSDAIAAQVSSLLSKYENWKVNPAENRYLRAELYKVFLPAVGKASIVELIDHLLRVLRGGIAG